MTSAISSIRLLVETPTLRKPRLLCKLGFSNSDASVYLFPYAPMRNYYIGHQSLGGIESKRSFDYTDSTLNIQEVPKISIHETGQVHIKAGSEILGKLVSLPLEEWKGQHLATVSVDNLENLPIFEGKISPRGPKLDHVIPLPRSAKSCKVVFYLAGDRCAFVEPNCHLVVTMRRTTLENPLYVGIQPKLQEPLGEAGIGGIMAIAGWNPNDEKSTDFLYIRGL